MTQGHKYTITSHHGKKKYQKSKNAGNFERSTPFILVSALHQKTLYYKFVIENFKSYCHVFNLYPHKKKYFCLKLDFEQYYFSSRIIFHPGLNPSQSTSNYHTPAPNQPPTTVSPLLRGSRACALVAMACLGAGAP